MTHLMVLPVKFPGVTVIFFAKIFEIVKFNPLENIFHFDVLLEIIFGLDPMPISQEISDLGYESRYIISNLGAIFVYWVLLTMLYPIFYALAKLSSRLGRKCKRINSFSRNWVAQFTWNGTI